MNIARERSFAAVNTSGQELVLNVTDYSREANTIHASSQLVSTDYDEALAVFECISR